MYKRQELIRESGGLCIADEVQIGFGRMGTDFWGFETCNVTPDIVTLGKSIGNGHPLSAVITSKEIADQFNNGMEYFNSYGGNPVSCAIGESVLQVIEDEALQKNAEKVGNYLIEELIKLQSQCRFIGQVRGQGLFIGIELIHNNDTLKPNHTLAKRVANEMKDAGILISVDGPDHNVLKIKPPMVFNIENANELVINLKTIFDKNYDS